MPQDDVQLSAKVTFETDQAKAATARKAADDVRAGAEGAAAAVSKVKPSPANTEELRKAGASGEKAFQAINAAAAAAEGNVMGVGRAVTSMSSGFPKLTAALAPLGLLTGTLAVLKAGIEKVQAAWEAKQAALRAGRMAAVEADIKKTTAAYAEQVAVIERLSDVRQRMLNIEQAKDDAGLRADLAALELALAREKAVLPETDTVGARELDLRYSQQRAALSEAAARRKSEREGAAIGGEMSDQLDKQRAAQAALKRYERDFAELSAQRTALIDRSNAGVSGIKRVIPGAENIWPSAVPELKELSAKMTEAVQGMRAASDALQASRTRRDELSGLRDVNATDRRTLGLTEQKRQIEDYVAGSGIDRDRSAETADLMDQLNASAADTSANFRNFIRSQLASQEVTNDLLRQLIAAADANARSARSELSRARRPGG